MSAPLPDQLDPWRAVQAGYSFAGEIPLERLPRVAEAVLGAEGPARYELTFGRDPDGQATIRGQVSMTLRLLCQRCLTQMLLPVAATVALGLTRATSGADALGLAAVEGLPEDLDPLPLGREPISPLDLVEDELLLAIPQIPSHPAGECRATASPSLEPPPPAVRDNPFAALAALRRKDADPESGET